MFPHKMQNVKKWVAQSHLTLCDPMNYTVHGILQARIQEWVDSPSPGGLPNPGIEPRSPVLQVDSLPAEPQGKTSMMQKEILTSILHVYVVLILFRYCDRHSDCIGLLSSCPQATIRYQLTWTSALYFSGTSSGVLRLAEILLLDLRCVSSLILE